MIFKKFCLFKKNFNFKNFTIAIRIIDQYYNKKTYIKLTNLFKIGWDFTIKLFGWDIISICYLKES